MIRLRWRIVVVLSFSIYLLLLTRVAITTWVRNHPTQHNLRHAIEWLPEAAVLWNAYARSLWQPLDDSTSPEVIYSYRQALIRNPFDIQSWSDLATEYSRLGDYAHAEAALRTGLVAIPHSPEMAWRLGNILLQRGHPEASYYYFRSAATSDSTLLPSVFELGWKLLGDPQRILERLVPTDPANQREFFYYLVWKKGILTESYFMWQKLLSEPNQMVIKLGENYAEALAGGGLGEEARRVWKQTLDLSGSAGTQSDGERITNGDFEAPLHNAGLDWRIVKERGVQISLDNFVARSGSRSLRIMFDGTTNPEFSSVWQWIPVEPGTSYRFRAFLRTENISTDNGIYLSLSTQKAPPAESWERSTANLVGTTPWAQQEIEFHTGLNTRVILVRLRRRRSSKLNHLLQGTVWLDDVSLQPSKY